MMKNLSNKLEVAANVAIILIACLIGAILIQRYFFTFSSTANLNRPQPTVGAKVNLPDVGAANVSAPDQSKTLILALQKGCHFCSESASFYKRLLQDTHGTNVKLIAAMPGNVEENVTYLKSLGLTEIEVKSSSLDDLDVSGTPTLILINNKGEIIGSWVGKLSQDKEAEVINKMNS